MPERAQSDLSALPSRIFRWRNPVGDRYRRCESNPRLRQSPRMAAFGSETALLCIVHPLPSVMAGPRAALYLTFDRSEEGRPVNGETLTSHLVPLSFQLNRHREGTPGVTFTEVVSWHCSNPIPLPVIASVT